jgi:poly-gamma-glutamate synthesis protein (capsule biosynthesis protein)
MFIHGPPSRLPPKNIAALVKGAGGFDVMSFACNHAMDWGWDAFYDTLDILKKNKIAVVGAGRNIIEARTPAIVNRNGTRLGFLGYLSIVSLGSVAEEEIPGCAPLRATNTYQPFDYQPGTPPLIITALWPEDKKAMEEDIKKLKTQADVVVVSMHCGVHQVPAVIAMYQKEAAYAAVDAGADLVLQHHAHILKGIEVYKGKTIFYGLGNFALEHTGGKRMKAWDPNYRKLREFYKIKPVPGYEKHHFLHDALKTVIAKAYISQKRIQKVTYIPAYITPDLEPEMVNRQNPKAQEVFDYVQKISESEDLKVKFSWESDEVLISQP